MLGIKGTLSVVELKILRQRLLAGTYYKASKGELYRMLAPGYVLDDLGQLVKDPNQRVQQGIALVFRTFRATGSITRATSTGRATRTTSGACATTVEDGSGTRALVPRGEVKDC